jgi:hypothetical protein
MAFSISVESPMKGAERISRSLGVYAGKVSITSYSQTLVECTAITKYFVPTGNATTGGYKDGIVSCQIDGPSSAGYIVRWDHTTGGFRCFSPVKSTTPTGNLVIVASATMSAAGVPVLWNQTTGALGNTGTAGTAPITINALVEAAAPQAAANTLIGTFSFVAVGFVRA